MCIRDSTQVFCMLNKKTTKKKYNYQAPMLKYVPVPAVRAALDLVGRQALFTLTGSCFLVLL